MTPLACTTPDGGSFWLTQLLTTTRVIQLPHSISNHPRLIRMLVCKLPLGRGPTDIISLNLFHPGDPSD